MGAASVASDVGTVAPGTPRDELEIRIGHLVQDIPSARAERTYPVHMRLTGTDRSVDGRLVLPFTPEEVAYATRWLDTPVPDTSRVKAFGMALHRALFRYDVARLVDIVRHDGPPCRYRIICDDPELDAIPWELLCDPADGTFLALRHPIVRGMASTMPASLAVVAGGLHILVVHAEPTSLPPLADEGEVTEIVRVLGAGEAAPDGPGDSGGTTVELLAHATLERLQDRLRERDRPPVHVLHFIGHAATDESSGRSVVLLEDDQGRPRPVSPTELASVVSGADLRLVFLNACESLGGAALDETKGFAPALMGMGIPAVVGMRLPILDAEAVTFAGRFYAGLADGARVDEAVRDTRQLAMTRADVVRGRTGLPIAYLRAGLGPLVIPTATGPPPRGLRGRVADWVRRNGTPRRAWAVLVAVVSAVAVLVGLYSDLLPFLSNPEPMGRDFNLAVAAPAVTDDALESDALAIGRHLAVQLELALSGDQPGEVEVRGPDGIGTIAGATEADRHANGASLATQINADVVMYGLLTGSDQEVEWTTLRPELHVATFAQGDVPALDLGGQFGRDAILPSPFDPTDIPGDAGFLTRITAMGRTLVGVARAQAGDHQAALGALRRALATAGWLPEDGQAVTQLLVGNSELALVFETTGEESAAHLEAAGEAFDEALAIDEDFHRATVGHYAVEVVRRSGDREAPHDDVDWQGLDGVAADLQDWLGRAGAGAEPSVRAAAQFNLGQAFLLASLGARDQAAADTADEFVDRAEATYLEVVALYEDQGDDAIVATIAPFAARAFARLGFIEVERASAGTDPDFEPARDRYESALAIAPSPQTPAFLSDLGTVELLLLGDACRAAELFEQAAARADLYAPRDRQTYLDRADQAAADCEE